MRRLPRMKSYGKYPENRQFGPFRVDDRTDASELVGTDAFMYAGSTETTPPHAEQLKKIVGFGSSLIVRYDGEGAYFLDKISPGVWRLEVFPDAVLVNDPYEQPSPEKNRITTNLQRMADGCSTPRPR